MTRFIGKRSYPVQNVEAGHLRHHQVEDQNIRLLPLDCLDGLLTVESNRRAESARSHMGVDDVGHFGSSSASTSVRWGGAGVGAGRALRVAASSPLTLA
jgi:hypothetical protein